MEEPTYIDISKDDLTKKLKQIHKGLSLEDLIDIWGQEGYKKEAKGENVYIYWRFRIADADREKDLFEIYMGEFENEKFLFGAILPQG